MKILWVSRHEPLESQRRELKRLYGEDVIIDQHDKPYANAAEILKVYRRGFYDEMVLVAPLSVCKVIVSYGIKPLSSEMAQLEADDPDIELRVNDSMRERLGGKARYYKFVRFKRMERIDITYSNLDT